MANIFCITLFICTLWLILISVYYISPLWLVKWIAKRNPRTFFYVDTAKKVIALTIDDGPHPTITPQILDVLKKHSAYATFFVCGANVINNEEVMDRIIREGHEVGNHLEKIQPSILLPQSEFKRQLKTVDELLQRWAPVRWFRPGSGLYTNNMLEQIESSGYRCALVSLYPQDTKVRNIWIISRYILAKVFPGAILILHDGTLDRVRTVHVLEKILPELNSWGYKVVTLTQLAALEN